MSGNLKHFGDTALRLARNPLGIIALFIFLIYSFASLVVVTGNALQAHDRTLLTLFLVGFPVLVLYVFYLLVSKHYPNLYPPSEYSKQEHFIEALTLIMEGKRIRVTGTLGDSARYEPFLFFEHKWNPKDKYTIEKAQEEWRKLVTSIPAENFLLLYSWYNANNKHLLAFQASSLAIATGDKFAASLNYSYASASLRKLNRYIEAKAFASLALEQDGKNIDAVYNLALIYNALRDYEKATEYAKRVLSDGTPYHKKRIHEEFPTL